MRSFLIFVCLAPFLICCSEDANPDYCTLARQIMNEFAGDMEKQHSLFCYGSGGGFLKQVNVISLSFATIGPKSLEELRLMMVTITEDFLQRINNDEQIREYLVHYPFQPSDLKFRILLMGLDGKPIHNKGKGKELLSGVLLLNGELSFEIENDEKMCLQDVHSETYNEGLTILKKQYPERFPLQ
ncbi:MAG: hypothetical protein WB791_05370 [Waddliaceae bacterium]